MEVTMLKGKIHRVRVKQAALDYVGSITIDEDLMDAAGILEYEKVQIVDIDNGNRFETYIDRRRTGQRDDLPERSSGALCQCRRSHHYHGLCKYDAGGGESPSAESRSGG